MIRSNFKRKRTVKKSTRPEGSMTLNKALAHAGVSSRRNAVILIKRGDVMVNNRIIKEPGHPVMEKDVLKVRGKIVRAEKKIYIILNKPKGFVTTVSDEEGRKTVLDLIGKSVKERLYPVGRLDLNTSGALLLTNDGAVAQKLSHPRYEVKKEYHVQLHKTLDEKDRQLLMQGTRLSDGMIKVDFISRPMGPEKNHVRVTLHSGKFRVIRRLFESLGYFVDRLDRSSYAGISKRGIPIGKWRFLTAKEIKHLQSL